MEHILEYSSCEFVMGVYYGRFVLVTAVWWGWRKPKGWDLVSHCSSYFLKKWSPRNACTVVGHVAVAPESQRLRQCDSTTSHEVCDQGVFPIFPRLLHIWFDKRRQAAECATLTSSACEIQSVWTLWSVFKLSIHSASREAYKLCPEKQTKQKTTTKQMGSSRHHMLSLERGSFALCYCSVWLQMTSLFLDAR